MLRHVTAWIRRHPVRTAVYALLVAGAAWGALTVRGILRGERNPLLTDIARAPLVRDFVEREFHIRYSIRSVALTPVCQYQIEAGGVEVELEGAASGAVDHLKACLTGSGEVQGIRVGGRQIVVRDVQFDWPKSVSAAGFSWSDASGEMVSAASFNVSPNDLSGSLRALRAAPVATVDAASAAIMPLAPPAVTIKDATAGGIQVDADPAAIAQLQTRLLAAAANLQAMGNATLPLPPRWSATARKLVVQVLIAAAIVLLILKAVLTRVPSSIGWRIAAILAPFAAFPLLALTNSWLAIVIAAPVLAIALWAVAYRRASEWQQRWEPAAIDIPAVLLALLLLVLRNWPAIAVPQIPTIDHVTLAQANIQNVAATVHQPACDGGTVQVTVPQASVTKLDVTLNGSALQTIAIERASANGTVQTGGIPDLRRIRYLPAAWKRNPPIAFCAAVTLQNSGAAPLPESQCKGAAGVVARAAVDYSGRNARFAADWNSSPASLTLTGSANLSGAQIDDLHTKPGASIRISKASARVGWQKNIAANVRVDSIQAAGATIGPIVADAGAPMPCSAGATTIGGSLGKVLVAASGDDFQVDGATFTINRPDSAAISAKVHTGRISTTGPDQISLPESDVQFEGITSRQTIPETLSAQVQFTTAAVGFSVPTRLTANLWTGEWDLPQQSLAVRQEVTQWIPQSIAFDLQGSGAITSVAGPLQANASVQLNFPQLAEQVGPVGIQINDLKVAGAWDAATGLAPAKISTGWNVATLPSMPSGFQLNEVSALHLSTRGKAVEAPAFTAPQIEIPTVPADTKFEIQGTPQSITVTLDGGQQVTVDSIQTANLRIAMPDLKLASIDLDTSAQVTRSQASFLFAGHTRLTPAGIDSTITAPLAAKVSTANAGLSFALTSPLDTEKLLDQTGIALAGIQPHATLQALHADVSFDGGKLAAVDLSGTLAAGPLVTSGGLEVSQKAPSSFHVAAPHLPELAVSASVPNVEIALNGDKLRASAAAEIALKATLASAPASPLFTQLSDAGAGLLKHAQKATEVFGAEDATAFPLDWDLEINGGSPVVSLTADRVAVNAHTLLHRIDIGQAFLDGSVDLHASANLDQDHLLVSLDAPADIGALGRRWQLNTPVLIALRPQLLPGSGGELFDGAFYGRLGSADAFHLAIGYGDALQFHSAFQQPFTSGTIDGLAQAAITWPRGAARIDSFGTLKFRGLEAGAITLSQPCLEDRLDGDIRFGTKGLIADRLLVPQLLADASRVTQLDTVDISAQVRSAADGLHLPGIVQAASAITLQPANEFIRLITSGLSLRLPPSALQYRNMALDFQVEQGQVRTEPVLLTLNGVQVYGAEGLTLDSRVRVLWGGHGYEPAPRLRDLIYTVQRSIEP